MDTQTYQARLTLTRFFEGQVRGEGVVTGRNGQAKRWFTAAFHGRATEKGLLVDEAIRFADGEVTERDWLIRSSGQGRFDIDPTDETSAVVIETVDGGNWRWRYAMDLPVNGRTIRFQVVDLMIPTDGGRVMAHTTLAKFGITLAHIYTLYEKA